MTRNSAGNLHAAMAEGHSPEVPTPEGTLTDKDLVDISNNIGNGWERLAICLKVPQTQIDHIKAEHRQSMQKQIYNMLLKWRSTDGCSKTLTSLLDKVANVPGVTIDCKRLKEIFGPDFVDNVFHKRSDDRQQASSHVPIHISQFGHTPGPSANVLQEPLAASCELHMESSEGETLVTVQSVMMEWLWESWLNEHKHVTHLPVSDFFIGPIHWSAG